MSHGEEKANRWRPRFSVRTLAILVTLVCVYFGAWEITKSSARRQFPFFESFDGEVLFPFKPPLSDRQLAILAEENNYRTVLHAESVVPLMIARYERDWVGAPPARNYAKRYYLWLFGFKVRLPFETTWKPQPLSSNSDLAR